MARKNAAPAATKAAAPKKPAAKKPAAKKPAAAKPAALKGAVKSPASIPTVGKPQTIVANQSQGAVIFPRRGDHGTVAPLIIPPGTAVHVDTDEWNERKKNPVVQSYLDPKYGILAEVKSAGKVAVSVGTVSELPIPEHLSSEKESGSLVDAAVEKETPGEVTIK